MPEPSTANTNQSELTLIMHTLGRMEGSNNAQFQALSENLSLIRADIKRVEENAQAQNKHLEESIKGQITFIERRVSTLEQEDRKQAIAIAKGSVTGGGLVALFVQGAIELIKRAS